MSPKFFAAQPDAIERAGRGLSEAVSAVWIQQGRPHVTLKIRKNDQRGAAGSNPAQGGADVEHSVTERCVASAVEAPQRLAAHRVRTIMLASDAIRSFIAVPLGALGSEGTHGRRVAAGFGGDMAAIPRACSHFPIPVAPACASWATVLKMARTWSETSSSPIAAVVIRRTLMPKSARDLVTYLAR